MFYDLIIKNGLIIDGSGCASYSADVAISGGRIVKIGKLEGEGAAKIINAEGKVVAPGFIDMHSHADMTFLLYPQTENYIMQGITTVIAGNCGQSLAPIQNYWQYQYFEADVLMKINSYFYYEEKILDLGKAKKVLKEEFGLDICWNSFGKFLEVVENLGISVNYIPLVGHGQIRGQVMGFDHKRKSTAEEKTKMKDLLLEAMEAGAYGMSTGLDYAPGFYADTQEIVELSQFMVPYDGIYSTHWRRTGLRLGTPKKQKKIDGVIEALEIGKITGLRVQISHLLPGFDVYPLGNDYMHTAAAKATLQVIDSYREQGVRAAFDVIPGEASFGLAQINNLASCFVPWIRQAGTLEQFICNIHASDYVQELINCVKQGKIFSFNPMINPQWDEFLRIIASKHQEYIDRSISEIAEEKGLSSIETVIELLKEEPQIKSLNFDHNIEAVKELLRHPFGMPSTDSCAFDLKSTWNSVVERSGRLPSTKTYCATVKYLKELGEGSLEAKVRKLTGIPAQILCLSDRGLLKQGYWADILIIDMENLRTNENYVDPRVYPSGFDYVIVNGGVVVENTQHTGLRSGKVLRRK